jgi:hypothetical protein
MRFHLTWALFALECFSFDPLDYVVGPLNKVGIEYDSIQGRAIPRSAAIPARLSKASQLDIQRARDIVDEALGQAEGLNKARLERPSRNKYNSKGNGESSGQDETPPAPLLKITDDLAAAAALVAEADAFGESLNGTRHSVQSRTAAAGTFWMQRIKRQGSWPWGSNPSNYTVGTDYECHNSPGKQSIGKANMEKVFRDVTAYGAKGDGSTVSLPGFTIAPQLDLLTNSNIG